MRLLLSACVMALVNSNASASPVIRQAAGASPAAIQSAVDLFRSDLGGANNGAGGSFKTGRREINWDGVPDNLAAPNNFPFNFFNSNSPRGAVFNSLNSVQLRVSADNSNPTSTPIKFGDVDASYPSEFITFSAQRLFAALHSNGNVVKQNIIETTFFIPGTNIPATVSGFGAVFTDVDIQGTAIIEFYGTDGNRLFSASAPVADKGLSFLGVSFNAGERIAKIVIISGTNLTSGNTDGVSGRDIIAMDDFIYGEPRARDYHRGDFDGDGFSDVAIFRPTTGTWFITRSGSGVVDIEQFGQNGDIPVEGDFDGDKIADLAVFRPSEGGWYIRRSSAPSTFITVAFGTNGDKPVAGDYDKDGITDIAVWRPSNGNYFVLRSSDNQSSFFAFPFGTNGDIPLLAGPQ